MPPLSKLNFRFWDDRLKSFNYFNLKSNFNQIPEDVLESDIFQSTGLVDSKGREIYEGDIVNIGGSFIPFTVKRENVGFVLSSKVVNSIQFRSLPSSVLEVKGNVKTR